ncbi:MAG: hypothetical protein AAB691_01755, partial [Patescibacteria group bacterium]
MKKYFFGLVFFLGIIPSLVFADEYAQLQQQLLFLIQQFTQLQSSLNNLQRISLLPCKTLDRNLTFNDSGDDVEFLHLSLEKEGFSVGGERKTKTYDDQTASAVSGFQQKYKTEILTPVGLEYGTGYFGKGTRAKLNSLYGCGAKAPDLTNNPIIRAPQAIKIISPQAGQTVTSSIRISGSIESDGWITAKGSAGSVTLFDSSGRQLSQTNIGAVGDKSVLPVSFSSVLGVNAPRTNYGYLLFASVSTSSVLATSSKEFRLPVKFGNVVKGSLQITFPQANQQLIAGTRYTFSWTGATGKVNLVLVSNPIELYGGKAVVWEKRDLTNTGSFSLVIPPSFGQHRLYVSDTAGRFGLSPLFSIAPGSGGGQIPHVTGVQGSQSLSVKQLGTWTVGATDPDGGVIDFSVDWGDGTTGRPGVSGTGGIQSAVFTHAYQVNGAYTQIYTVSDSGGLSDQYSYQVQVGSAT